MPSDGTELALRAHKVCEPAQKALDAVLARIQATNCDIFYAIRCRPKTSATAISKVERKRTGDKPRFEPKPNYEPEDITDIAGVRVVTLFREDVIGALKIFLQMINHEGDFSTNSPFKKRGLREAIVYTTAPVGDPEAITSRLRSVFEVCGHPITDSNILREKTGYSSVHLVADVEVVFDKITRRVPAEIQIRTVFEDAWGEIDHKLRLSLNRSRAKQTEIESWQPHLNVLKSFVDGCGQYAGVIKNQAIDPSLHPQYEMAPFVPVDSADEALAQLGEIPATLRATFVAAYEKRKTAIEARNQAGADSETPFLEAAELFKTAAEEVKVVHFESSRSAEAATFFAEMERAFCLLSSGKKPNLDEAITIYSNMQARSPQSAIVYYRYGIALQELGELVSAEKKYEQAFDLVKNDKYVPAGHWLRSVIPRQWGYCLWTRSLAIDLSQSGGLEMRLSLLRDAFVITEKSFALAAEGKLGQARAANNALYYGTEFEGLWRDGVPGDRIQKPSLEKYIALLESKIDLQTAPKKFISWLDTLCRTYAQFGDGEKARLAAERIEQLLGPGLSGPAAAAAAGAAPSYLAIMGQLNSRERDMLEHALWVLSRATKG